MKGPLPSLLASLPSFCLLGSFAVVRNCWSAAAWIPLARLLRGLAVISTMVQSIQRVCVGSWSGSPVPRWPAESERFINGFQAALLLSTLEAFVSSLLPVCLLCVVRRRAASPGVLPVELAQGVVLVFRGLTGSWVYVHCLAPGCIYSTGTKGFRCE